MPNKHYHEAPLVEKTPISIVVLENSDLESTALRSVLEYFGYRVDIHWVGSRKEFVEILKGNIPTQDFIILSCHGDEQEGIYTLPEEKPISASEIKETAKLVGKTILSLGCETGTKELAEAFLNSGCKTYIAPSGAPFGNTALLFAIHLCYEMRQNKKSFKEAMEAAKNFNSDSRMFALFE